jgi:Txe/YoeB family toxin of Txe-Axe toxin-antitoxin module
MRLEFKPQAFEDLQFWVQTNPKLARRLLRLIECYAARKSREIG